MGIESFKQKAENTMKTVALAGMLGAASLEGEAQEPAADPSKKIEMTAEADSAKTIEKKYKPIIVHDESDPRLKAYRDSLEAYDMTGRFLSWKPYEEDFKYTIPYDSEIPQEDQIESMPSYKGIKPVDNMLYDADAFPNNPDKTNSPLVPVFKKPTQEVIYKPPILNPKYTPVYYKANSYKRELIGFKTRLPGDIQDTYYYYNDDALRIPSRYKGSVSDLDDLFLPDEDTEETHD